MEGANEWLLVQIMPFVAVETRKWTPLGWLKEYVCMCWERGVWLFDNGRDWLLDWGRRLERRVLKADEWSGRFCEEAREGLQYVHLFIYSSTSYSSALLNKSIWCHTINAAVCSIMI